LGWKRGKRCCWRGFSLAAFSFPAPKLRRPPNRLHRRQILRQLRPHIGISQIGSRIGKQYITAVWGIGDLNIKTVESGVILRFSYRVLDPEKARALDDKKLNPVLESPEKGIRLVVPTMEKVGQLRQAPKNIEAGESYRIAFSNSGRRLKPGDRVDIVIGNFHARGLLVE